MLDPTPVAPTPIDVVCTAATTTTAPATSTTIAPSLCDLFAQLPSDQVAEGWDSVWDGTVTGSIQPVGCTSVAQTGSMILFVLADGEVVGVGRTDTGAYGCDNGADIPPSSYAYGFTGELTDHFALTFDDGVTMTSGAVVDGRAVLQQDTGFGVVTIELQCRDCAADPTESTLSSEAGG